MLMASISDATTFITKGADYLTPWEDRSLGTDLLYRKTLWRYLWFCDGQIVPKRRFCIWSRTGKIEKIVVIYNGTARDY